MNGGKLVVSLTAFVVHAFLANSPFIFIPYAALLPLLNNSIKHWNTGETGITPLSFPWVHQETSTKLRNKGGIFTNVQSS